MRAVAAAMLALLLLPAGAVARSADVAALQVGLCARGTYRGDVDGIDGPATRAAVRRFQRRHGLVADGVAGPRTRRALGRHGRHPYGSRVLRPRRVGWDVAALQFRLGQHGFPSSTVDGGYGSHTVAAVARFQAWVGLTPDGVAGPAALRPPRPPAGPRPPPRAPPPPPGAGGGAPRARRPRPPPG